MAQRRHHCQHPKQGQCGWREASHQQKLDVFSFLIVPILFCDSKPRETTQEWGEFLQVGCKGKAGCQEWTEDKKLHLFRVWESRIGSLRNNGAEVFRAVNVQIIDQLSTTQSQRLLLWLLSLCRAVPYSEGEVPQMFKHLFKYQRDLEPTERAIQILCGFLSPLTWLRMWHTLIVPRQDVS